MTISVCLIAVITVNMMSGWGQNMTDEHLQTHSLIKLDDKTDSWSYFHAEWHDFSLSLCLSLGSRVCVLSCISVTIIQHLCKHSFTWNYYFPHIFCEVFSVIQQMCLPCDEYFSSLMLECERPAIWVIKWAQKMTRITAIMSSEHNHRNTCHETVRDTITWLYNVKKNMAPLYEACCLSLASKIKCTENKSHYMML